MFALRGQELKVTISTRLWVNGSIHIIPCHYHDIGKILKFFLEWKRVEWIKQVLRKVFQLEE